jgi:RNA polymerase sigma-70 factor (ECF subfamily)
MRSPSDTRSKAALSLVTARDSAPPDFDSVYAEHVDFVWRSLRLLGVPREQVEDAAQDAFGVVSRHLPLFEGRSSLRTWVFAIVQKVAANHRRTVRRKVAPLEPLHEALTDAKHGPDVYAEATEAAQRIELFCAGLDAGRRAVFMLALLEDVPAPEVAEALGIPLNTVYSRVRALRQDLRHWLERCEVEDG